MTLRSPSARRPPSVGREPFSNEPLWEKVEAHLREQILSNALLPGTELQEVALAKSLGVSRGPVREALARLGADGLVIIRPRRGAVVAELSKSAFLGAYQVREALEALAVRLATPLFTPVGISRLEALVEEMQRHAERSEVQAFFEANAAFHREFVEVSANEALRHIHRRLTADMSRYRRWSLALRGTLERSIKEHQGIVRAVKAGDVDRAAQLTAAHIRVPQQRLEAAPDDNVLRLALGRQRTTPKSSGERDT